MNQTESHSGGNVAHVKETNISLLFPTLIKETWQLIKSKGFKVFVLLLLPLVSTFVFVALIVLGLWAVLKIAGVDNFWQSFSWQLITSHVAQFWTLVMALIILISSSLYFSACSVIATLHVLGSENSNQLGIWKVWRGVSYKNIGSILVLILMLITVLLGGYFILVIPFAFLITFYLNTIFTHVLEGKKGIDAMTTSRQSVRGFGTTVFVNIAVIMVFNAILGQLCAMGFVSLYVYLIGKVYFGLMNFGTVVWIMAAALIIGLLIQVALQTFVMTFNFVQYKKLHALRSHENTRERNDKNWAKFWFVLGTIITIFIIARFLVLQYRLSHDPQKSPSGSEYNLQQGAGVDDSLQGSDYSPSDTSMDGSVSNSYR